MTALLVDLGNSLWKFTHSGDTEFAEVVAGPYDDLGGLVTALASCAPGIDRVWMASVLDQEGTRSVLRVLQRAFPVEIRQVKATDAMPNLVSGYRKPEQLGIDRLLAMVAARGRTQAPFCVVDAGTAVTIDFVAADGRHLGGFILPGGRMFRECLLANTAIPRDEQVEEHAELGRDTPTAVALAGRYAVAGIVDRFLTGGHALFPGAQAQTFVGGGDADEFTDLLPSPCTKLDHLVLRGLAVLAAGGDS